ncbi:MAG: PEP-CTERM sorting domain-containing protein [Pyrinomonadaceae bacterium]|nr:PEP-CTERM sorting domain-containing protein [Phycisphaerales bacterium]
MAIPTPIQTFTRTLNVVPIPAPASLIAVGGVAAFALTRRRVALT